MPANGFEIARRLEAHAQAARGALADQTRRALATAVGSAGRAEIFRSAHQADQIRLSDGTVLPNSRIPRRLR